MRRQEAIDRLGGECISCGATGNLEVDHIDPALKSFSISKLWGIAKARYDAELEKCQILCKDCHKHKTIKEQKVRAVRFTDTPLSEVHGTYTGYGRYQCRCEKCKQYKRDTRK
jgi:5-methylcytosine-specific restriction endonuclease McrA